MKRALVIGSTAAGLQEAANDATAWKLFLEAPGRWTWEQDGNIILDTMVWRPIRGAEHDIITPYEVRYIINDSITIEEIESHIGWLQEASDRVVITSNHGFRVRIKNKWYSGFYLGENCVYTYGYMQEKVFRHLEGPGRLLRIHDMCFAGGAKHTGGKAFTAAEPMDVEFIPRVKGFEIQPDEIQSKYVKAETPQDGSTLTLVAAKAKQPAYGMIMGGDGTHSPYSTQWHSLFTWSLLSAIRRLMPAGVTLNIQGVDKIIQLTNERCDMVKHIDLGQLKTPHASVQGKNQLLFTN